MPPKSKSSQKRRRSGRPKKASPAEISPEDQKRIEDAWKEANEEGNECISFRAAGNAMKKSLNLSVKKSDFGVISTSSEDGMVDYETFIQMASEWLQRKEKALRAFSLFDKDQKGLVVVQDLEKVATELGETFTAEELEEMVNEFDQSGEGLLTSEDFVRIAKKVGL